MSYSINLSGYPPYLKIYYLNPDKRDEFCNFFNGGIPDDQVNIQRDADGRPIAGARKWLIDEGVKNVVAWLYEYPPVDAQSGWEAQPKELVLVLTTDDPNTDWYKIPGIKEFLRRADPPIIKQQPSLGISSRVSAPLVNHVLETTLEIISVVASTNDVNGAEALPDLLQDAPGGEAASLTVGRR